MSISPSSIRVRRDGAKPEGRYTELPRKNKRRLHGLVVVLDADGCLPPRRVEHRVRTREGLADLVFQLLAGPTNAGYAPMLAVLITVSVSLKRIAST